MSIERMAQHLIMHGELSPRQFDDIIDDATRAQLESRLAQVGLKLVHNPYRNTFGVRLLDEADSLREQELMSNTLLNSDHAAMIAILWIKLVGPKRVKQGSSQEQSQPEGVHVNAIAAEFKSHFPKGGRIESVLTTLRRVGLITQTGDWIQAGHNLETAIDGARMSALIQESVTLMEIRERAKKAVAGQVHLSDTDKVLSFLQQARTPVALADITYATELDARKVGAALRKLRKQNQVNSLGPKTRMKYQYTGE